MSEISPVGTYNKPKAGDAELDAAGRHCQAAHRSRAARCSGLDMKIVDDAGAGAALGRRGVRQSDGARSLGVRAAISATPRPARWTRRAGSPPATWRRSTRTGSWTITDRTKDVIKSGGEWISSITLENIAVAHPDVAEAAIIAAHHAKWDERPLLLVVAKAGRTIDAAGLLASYAGRVPKWWLPDAVVVVDELPHTATGKLNKLALRTQYGQHLLQNAAE